MNRAYSLIEIKAVDEERRVIEGVASSPTTDLMDDIVEPMGAEFELPIPFLWQHDRRQPIGHVTRAKPTKDGIPVRIELARTDEPGTLKERLDEAWQSIKLGLVRGLSIGFKPIEMADIAGTWGQRFIKWRWLELSAVTIPANIDATMQTVKSYDERIRAASGRRIVRLTEPGASGLITKHTRPEDGMTITERIAAYEAKRAANVARMDEITRTAGDAGRTKNESEQEEFDTLRDEIKSVDQELVDLRDMEKLNATKAKPVDPAPTTKAAADSRSTVFVEREEKLAPGIEFARFAMCMAAAKGDVPRALQLARTHYPKQQRAIHVLKAAADLGTSPDKLIANIMQTKSAVPAGTTTDDTWAEPLVAYNQFAGDFIEFLRPRTILGRFGAGGVPALRAVPFNVHIRGQTSGGSGYWVGEGLPKPVTKFDFNDTYHGYTKVAAISVLTEELIRFSNPSAEALVRDGLAGALIERLDTDFVDPAVAVSVGVNPASITNGVVAIVSSGTDGDAVRADIQALWAAAIAANLPITSAVYITTPALGLSLGLMMNALGQPEFPGITMMGGSLLGVPLITSNYVPIGTFILAFASEIYLSDDGVVTIDASREASIQMLDSGATGAGAPTNDSVTPTPTTLVSMFQTNSIALRAERFINWSKRRSTAVALLEGVGWGGAATS
jgi:HK97 family phage major capsid protein/HK97 family phage prohead protease